MVPPRADRLWPALFPVCCLLLAACAPSHYLYSEAKFEKLEIPMRVHAITIVDGREKLEDLDVPVFKKSPRKFNKKLVGGDTLALLNQIKRNAAGSGSEVSLRVSIEKALVGFEQENLMEETYGQFLTSIGFYQNQAKVGECRGEAMITLRSLNSTERQMKKLFEEGLVVSAYKCLDEFNKGLRNGIITLEKNRRPRRI